MKRKWVFWIKLAILVVIVGAVGWKLHDSWHKMSDKHVQIDWRWGGVAVAGFAGSMLTAACVWRWLAWKMGDRSPLVPLLGSYTYSQMGKYFPGKVVLLLMRIERTGRFGMSTGVCTMSTLLENALYMISGALVGMTAIVRIAGEVDPNYRVLLWPVTAVVVAVLIAACSPPVFYGLVNRILRRMKKPELAKGERLGIGTLALAVLGFVPCWIFGGLALWGSSRCVHDVSLADCWWYAGAYGLSVIIGMASLLPGGTGIRDAALGAAAALQFSALGVAHADAVILGGAVAVLQRIFQVIVEMLLGLMGATVTGKRAGEMGKSAVDSKQG